ncbi:MULTISPECIES: alpha/beta fold hydrolase [Edwardsiella]|uniref:Alpha/beta hydrolase n=1 Tax=Edwardsiella anguillarum TaxID=1821960 RepID=A0ABY8SI37_9GAMM|nr:MULTISPECIES: alpha/beta hydrolase [Edwardsiella]AKM48094.1 alpha/beta hydrolase [Edwardsiella sp. EA181011]GAJ68315.1 putative hydrolase [Edwardsiella piscicida]AKR77517.1 alpha/beta hydrolase [Edwardsiella sp. LADL05-105]KAB0589258.1 alpha/beta hydrolase [Edwardsiella anguillarum]RFT03915.1 alpha/beta hydrolase [Edwardsiella anguillarum]
MLSSCYSTVARCRVRWLILPGEGIPVVFIHGLGCAASYDYPRVVGDPHFRRRAAILIDLPGYGYSDKPWEYGYTIREQALVVNEVIRAIGLRDYFIYGHSMGGSIAIESAAEAAAGVRGLIVSEPNFHPGGGLFSQKIYASTQQDYIVSGHSAFVASEDSTWAGSLAVAAPWAVWRSAASLIAGNAWLALFLRMMGPTGLIFGEASLPDADFSRLQSLGTTCITVAQCGHAMAWENPAGLAGALSAFCARYE